MVGGKRGVLAAALLAAAVVISSPGTAGTSRAAASNASVDPSLRAGELALVRTTPGSAGALSAKVTELGAMDVRTFSAASTVVARLSAQALAAVQNDSTVTVATRDTPVVALWDGKDKTGFEGDDERRADKDKGDKRGDTDTTASSQFVSILAIRSQLAWSRSTGDGVTVAIMDTGVAAHPDLRGKVKVRVDFVHDGSTLADPAGHGTHIAGVIAANGVMKGVAPDADLVSLRVLDATGNGTLAGVVGAFDWLLKHRGQYDIKVLNLSWGAPQATSYHKDILSALAESAWFSGIAVVAAAGNGGPAAGTVVTPGSDPFVITMGSFDDNKTAGAADDSLSPFSAKGPTLDGFTKPDTLAPGRSVWSLRVPGLVYCCDAAGAPIGSTSDPYIRQSGTSVSAGFGSGVAALVAAAHKDYSPTKIKGAIVASGRAVSGSTTKAVDAPQALVSMTRVNQGLVPSRLLMQLLKKSGDKIHLGGVSWEGLTWESISWETVSWETVSWEGVTWEGVTWQLVSFR